MILAGSANVIPRLCVYIFNLWGEGRFTEAIEAQQLLSAADWVLIQDGDLGHEERPAELLRVWRLPTTAVGTVERGTDRGGERGDSRDDGGGEGLA